MKRKLSLILVALLLSGAGRLLAQTTDTQPRDLFYDEVAVKEREPIPYDYVSESDVYWHKRVWRVIDVKEKMNLPFSYEGLDWSNLKPLISVLRDAAIANEITVYDEDNFQVALTPDVVSQRGASVDTLPQYDLQTGEVIGDTIMQRPFDPNKVLHWRVKEDWFFNKKTSTMQVRIMGLAPLYYDEEAKIETPLFWIYYPSSRSVLSHNEAFNPKNDAQRMSWDDMFQMRLFSSVIIKESNVFDRRIQEYATGLDALRESDRIKEDIFNFEHDLWSY
ncbi:MAG: gliding motility protein GldN [Chitinophagales bacterium]|nr:gliding motility protein GldN [Bacteroidota bacterium]MBX7140449.1 gliding motility protein GldN [Chitinophagales bacterium]